MNLYANDATGLNATCLIVTEERIKAFVVWLNESRQVLSTNKQWVIVMDVDEKAPTMNNYYWTRNGNIATLHDSNYGQCNYDELNLRLALKFRMEHPGQYKTTEAYQRDVEKFEAGVALFEKEQQ